MLALLMLTGCSLMAQALESSPSRIEAAENGGKDVAWPRKPDNRLSSLSGKMKEFREIPGQNYGDAREFRSDRLFEDRQTSRLAALPLWSMSESPIGNKGEAFFTKDSSVGKPDDRHRFDPTSSRQEEVQVRDERQLTRQEAMGWSRTSRTGQATDGSLQMYEGRLTRVRQQVNRETVATDRDLGEGRREKYSPDEVQRLLQQKPGLPDLEEIVRPALPVRAESPAAFRPLTAGN